jgi:hypothetical protein
MQLAHLFRRPVAHLALLNALDPAA